MPDDKPQFDNFKDAFCAYYRVPPEKYARAVLRRSLPVTRRVLAWPILAFNRTFFATDLDIIRSLGAVRTADNFSLQLDELHTINRLERNIRRGFLGIRASGTRLMGIWQTVAPYIRSDAPEAFPPAATDRVDGVEGGGSRSLSPEILRSSGAVQRRVSQARPVPDRDAQASSSRVIAAGRAATFGRAQDNSTDTLRRLEIAYVAAVSGTALPEAVRHAGLSDVNQFLELLEVRGTEQPKYRWLVEQLRRANLVEALVTENTELKSVLAEQTVELARLRGVARQ